MTEWRSVSQESAFTDCGLRYRLSRIEKVPEIPSWWLVGGSAFHAAIEDLEQNRLDGRWMSETELTTSFIEHFAHGIAEQAQRTGVPPDEWRAAKRNTEDQQFWLTEGVAMVLRYRTVNTDRNFEIAVIDDRPAIELEFLLDVNGVRIKGYIDQVLRYANGDVVVRDLKTGARPPEDTFQLAVYAWALRKIHHLPVKWGCYYDARKGVEHDVDLDHRHPWAELVYRFQTMDRAEKAGIYMPRVSSFCNSCAVRPHCPIMSPETAKLVLDGDSLAS